MKSELTLEFRKLFRDLPERIKKQPEKIIVCGNKTRSIRALNLKNSIRILRFIRFELELVGELLA